MKKAELDLSFSNANRAKLAHLCASGADWKSFRVGATSRQLRRMQAAKQPVVSASTAKGFGG